MDRKPRTTGETRAEPFYGTPDEETPELTPEDLSRSVPASQFFAERGLKLPGRPPSADAKMAVSLRLDRDIVAAFKADGPGWQTRMNAALRRSLESKDGPA
ncbi:MAG: BrnA antitoxin family protein [Devosia sp.]